LHPIPIDTVLDAQRVEILRNSLGDAGTREVYQMYLDNGSEEIEAIRQSLMQGDVKGAAGHVHNLKGSSANLGFLVVHQWSISLEALLKLGAISLAAPLLAGLQRAFRNTEPAVKQMVIR
jgi:HPt (histidine-containing phosphotransfer) domain-containing protein